MKSLEEIIEDNYRACQCPDGCNGCERLDGPERVLEFLRRQRDLWPDQSAEKEWLYTLIRYGEFLQ